MKIWPLLIASLLPLNTYATVNDNDNDNDNEDSYENSEDEEFEGFYDDEDFVSISTGTKKSLAKAPSVASVITAKTIKQMGFRTLSEVMATVPGMHVSKSSEMMAPKFLIRGMNSIHNAQTLMLVNGTPISSVVRGDRHALWGGFPLAAIARIEVIRGPGSALHGADAFAGVINIITKDFSDIEKSEVGARLGSFNTRDIWAQTAVEFNDIKVALSAEFTDTDGHDGTIHSDAQTALDGIFNIPAGIPAASLAPGSVNLGYEGYDLRADISYGDLTLKFGYQNIEDFETGQGVSKALDARGRLASDKVLINLNYATHIKDDWRFEVKLSHYRTNEVNEKRLQLFPPGAFGGAFPDGFSGNPQWFEKNEIAKSLMTYTGFAKQTITFGGGYREEDVYKSQAEKNFDGITELPEFIDLSDTDLIFLPEEARNSHFAFIQDEVQLAPDWELTVGLRYDNYSDFGTTVNPRVALVWATDRNLSTKFLYGRAFRAPTFGDTILINNPVALGNPDIEAETIDTFEVAFNYQLSPQVHVDLNVYHFTIEDAIDFVPDNGKATATAQNVGELKGYGLEFELNYDINDSFSMLANYAYQDTEDQGTNDDLGGAPNHQGYLQLRWSVNDSLSLNTEVHHIGKQQRNSLDLREATGAYTNVAFSLNYYDIFDGMDLQIKLSNAFDEDIREPSLGPTAASPTDVKIADDLPQAGRAIMFGLQKKF